MGVIEAVLNIPQDPHLSSSGSSPDLRLTRHDRRRQHWQVHDTLQASLGPLAERHERKKPPVPEPSPSLEPTMMMVPMPMKYACHPATRSDAVRYASAIYRSHKETLVTTADDGSVVDSVAAGHGMKYAAHPATRSDAVRYGGNTKRLHSGGSSSGIGTEGM